MGMSHRTLTHCVHSTMAIRGSSPDPVLQKKYLQIKAGKMITIEHVCFKIASSTSVLFCQNKDTIKFKIFSYIKKYQLWFLIILTIFFSHIYTSLSLIIIHDDKTVISYFIPRHQTFKFSYNFKAKIYNGEFDELKSIGTQAFYCIYL